MKGPEDQARAQRVRELFEQAIDLPENERSGFLKFVCGSDLDLQESVVKLLNHSATADSQLQKIEEDLIWPSLHSFREDPSILEDWLGGNPGEPLGTEDTFVGKTISHFKILAPIGRGGMGMVYKAHDHLLERTVALKFLPPAMGANPDAKERFINEAKAACGIEHPNIATVYEIGETEDSQMFIAMGFYKGETLKERLDRVVIPPEEAIEIIRQLASALQKVHQSDIVHRDIKPGNLMITEDGTLKLLDFGLAKLSFASGYTQIGQMLGTVAYMSPEQASGKQVDHRTDIWSLGVVLYEMLAGARPFDGEDAPTTMRAILDNSPSLTPELKTKVPKRVQEVLGLCLAKNPDQRYQSADELIADLDRITGGKRLLRQGGLRTWKPYGERIRFALYAAIPALSLAIAISIFIGISSLVDKTVRFIPVTENALIQELGAFAGFCFGDYDGDGLMDLVVANQGGEEAVYLYHNDGGGQFHRITEGLPAANTGSGMTPIWADQDNDGDLDLFVCTEFGKDLFFRNKGDGSFTKETSGEWVNTTGSGNFACWGDYDSDGFIDLYVANFGSPNPEANFLYRNTGDGVMDAVYNESNSLQGMSHGCLFTDYDNDGDMDLFVGGQDKVQFCNDGNGTMTWVPREAGGIARSTLDVDVGFYSADYDNDGDLDVIYTTWNPDPSFLLYRNEGGLRFIHVPHAVPSGGSIRAMGVAWGDYDNDGWQDMLIANRIGKNLLYHNKGDGTFERIVDSPIVREGQASTSCSFVDYDNDGDLDLVVSNGLWSDFKQSWELYRNEGNGNNWISLSLSGTVSNASAIGAKIRIQSTISGRKMTQLREISGNGSTDMRAHFGMGDAKLVDRIRIEWPSGIVQELLNVKVNQFLMVTEEGNSPI